MTGTVYDLFALTCTVKFPGNLGMHLGTQEIPSVPDVPPSVPDVLPSVPDVG